MNLTPSRSLFLSLVFVAACSTEDPSSGNDKGEDTATKDPAPTEEPVVETPETPEETPPAEEPVEVWDEQFGDDLEDGIQEIAFAELASKAAELDGQEFITRGTVRASCTKRGCWMEVRPTDDRNGAGLTTRFKNYGFFVPLNSRGAEIKMQFKVNATELTAAQVKEYEAEGGVVTNKKEDGTASVVELTATGVLMRGRKK